MPLCVAPERERVLLARCDDPGGSRAGRAPRSRRPDNWVERGPHDGFDRLRELEPVSYHRRPDGTDFYALTRYEDVVAVGKDWRTFSSKGGHMIDDTAGSVPELMMTGRDPPRHDAIRRLVSQGFTTRRIMKLEDHIRSIATSIIERVTPKGECDFVVDVAAELPLEKRARRWPASSTPGCRLPRSPSVRRARS